jgi:hypothetical protein
LTAGVSENYHPMKMRAVGTALLGLLVLCTPASRADTAESVPAGLLTRLQRIESAFRQGDAGSLRLSFPATGKMRVDLKGLTDGQESYGSGQLQVMFGQIFAEFRTRDFLIPQDEVRVSSQGTAFARGRWVRANREGVERRETLTFTLRADGGDWRILEIRSSR